MSGNLVCWRCGASLAALTLPLRRLEECPACGCQLHVCRMCRSWDPRLARKCREDDAEEVRLKDQANFCDFFRPRAEAFDSAAAAAEQQSRNHLDALFGKAPGSASSRENSPADALFGSRRGDKS